MLLSCAPMSVFEYMYMECSQARAGQTTTKVPQSIPVLDFETGFPSEFEVSPVSSKPENSVSAFYGLGVIRYILKQPCPDLYFMWVHSYLHVCDTCG